MVKITKTAVTVQGPTGTVQLPADYVADHVELGYAQTSHAGQGRTVDHSLLVIAEGDIANRAGVYVPMTRGRHTNYTIAVTGTPDPQRSEAAEIIADALERRWIDSPAIGEMADNLNDQRTIALDELAHVKKMASQNRQRTRQRTHPLHLARGNHLSQKYKQLVADKPASPPIASTPDPGQVDGRTEAVEAIRRFRRQHNLPEVDGPETGL